MISHPSLRSTEEVVRPQRATSVPAQGHEEATRLAQAEYRRLLDLLDQLEGEEWSQPTFCTDWNVKQMVAHLSGAVAAFASWGEFKRQMIQNPYMREAAIKVDAINRIQVEDRAGRSTAALVDEFREQAPRAIRTRARLPWLLRALPIPWGPPLGTAPLHYLTDTIYTRDWWMHRFDLCAATGREMVLDEAHDGRLMALVMRDLASRIEAALGERTVDIRLTGPAGGLFRLGPGEQASATVELTPRDINLLASGRITLAEGRRQVRIHGDQEVADWLLAHCEVPY